MVNLVAQDAGFKPERRQDGGICSHPPALREWLFSHAPRGGGSVEFLGDDVAYGRPVDVKIASDGSLLVADDVGNTIWRLSTE